MSSGTGAISPRASSLPGGDFSSDHATNEILYALRLGRLINIVGDVSSVEAPMRILDAGCGKGFFARAMARFGHRVDGIDTSPHAIDECRRGRAADDAYAVSSLSGWAPSYLYDVVYSIDVLFHIMDDAVWESSVRNLVSLVRMGGKSCSWTTSVTPTASGVTTRRHALSRGTVRCCPNRVSALSQPSLTPSATASAASTSRPGWVE